MGADTQQNQNKNTIPETTENTEDGVAWEPAIKKRKSYARFASFIICLSTTAAIVYYAVADENTTIEFHVDDDISKELTAIKNKTIECYKREEKENFPVLLTLSFGLLSIILGTIVDRLSLVFEELRHYKSRHKSICKMLKACFSGISWGAVVAVLVVIFGLIITPFAKNATFDKKYIVYICSGIGVGPLIMRLLNLNTESEVHISTIIEKKETCIAHGLAWSYYFNYLEKALPKFNEKFPNKSIPPNDNGESRGSLDSDKMLLLISHDCRTEDSLQDLDNNIEKVVDINNEVYSFPVYRLTYNGTVRTYVVKYVKQPLETLYKMSIHGRIKAFDENELEYQVKLLYKTLSDILNNPLNQQCKEKCILIPVKVESLSSLQNGGLVRLITRKVEYHPEWNKRDGFMKPLHAKQQPKMAQEDETSDGDDERINSTTSSHVEDIKSAKKSEVQYGGRWEQFRHSNNQASDNPLVHPYEKQTEKNMKAPVQGKLRRKYKQKKSDTSEQQQMLSNNGDRFSCDNAYQTTLLKDLNSSHVVDINPVEGRAQYSRLEHFNNTDNPSNENNASTYPDEEHTKELPRHKEPKTGQRQIKCKKPITSELQPMLPDNDNKSFCVKLPEKNINEDKQAEKGDEDVGLTQSSLEFGSADEQNSLNNDHPTGEEHTDTNDESEL